MDRSLGIVVPAYRPDVEQLRAYVRSIVRELEPDAIRIELDAPAPGVASELERLPAQVNVTAERRGKGAAITDGFERLDTDVLAFADADGSTPSNSLADVVAPVLADDADLAVGSRRHPDAVIRSHQTYARRWLGHGFVLLARQLLDVDLSDYQCGAKAIDRDAWTSVRDHLYEPGFAWDIELIAMAAALEFRISEVPIEWEDQPGSTVSPITDTIALGRALLVARHRSKLVRDDRLHSAIETYRDEDRALVNRQVDDD